jgi:hypothetical protein
MHESFDIGTRIHTHDGLTSFERIQDCTPIAERCKALHNEGHTGSKDMKLAASIPNVMVEKYCNDHGILFSEWCSNPQHIRRMLSDPALAHFRVWKGQI